MGVCLEKDSFDFGYTTVKGGVEMTQLMEVQPLTQKEILYLEDAKSHEEMCIAKYGTYAEQLKDPQLKNLFIELKQNEQRHLATIEALLKDGGARTTRLS